MKCAYICSLIIPEWMICICVQRQIILPLGRNRWMYRSKSQLVSCMFCAHFWFIRAPSSAAIQRWLQNILWTPELREQWQEFYNSAPRRGFYGRSGQFHSKEIPVLPSYKDLPSETCQKSTGTKQAFGLFLTLALFCCLLISNA